MAPEGLTRSNKELNRELAAYSHRTHEGLIKGPRRRVKDPRRTPQDSPRFQNENAELATYSHSHRIDEVLAKDSPRTHKELEKNSRRTRE